MHAKSTEHTAKDLVLVDLPNGECARLRPERHSTRVVDDSHWSPADRAGLTELGRDYLARERAFEGLFGSWPTVAEACELIKRDRVA
jgi:hypothetical protein